SPEVRVLLRGVLFLFLVVIATDLRSVVVVVRFRRRQRLVFLCGVLFLVVNATDLGWDGGGCDGPEMGVVVAVTATDLRWGDGGCD
ncbi:hypothetical protein A2U01_0085795, partial [Trifolium medium]|nr:hypothetical protein [Trifolium medium]